MEEARGQKRPKSDTILLWDFYTWLVECWWLAWFWRALRSCKLLDGSFMNGMMRGLSSIVWSAIQLGLQGGLVIDSPRWLVYAMSVLRSALCGDMQFPRSPNHAG